MAGIEGSADLVKNVEDVEGVRIKIIRAYDELHVYERDDSEDYVVAHSCTFEGVAHVNIISTTEITVKGVVMAFDSEDVIVAIYESQE